MHWKAKFRFQLLLRFDEIEQRGHFQGGVKLNEKVKVAFWPTVALHAGAKSVQALYSGIFQSRPLLNKFGFDSRTQHRFIFA